jgi:hypothetical protein
LDRLSSIQVDHFSGQALVEVANFGYFLGPFKALREVSVNDLRLDVLCSPYPVARLVGQEPRRVFDDLRSVCDIVDCAKIFTLEAHTGRGHTPAAEPKCLRM